MGKRRKMLPMVDLAEVIRSFMEELIGGGTASELCRKSGIPTGDVSNVLNRKKNRRATMDWLVKIAVGYEMPWSQVFSRLSIIAAKMEAVSAAGERGASKAPAPPR